MAIANKDTVRNEVDRVKSDFDSLCAEGKVSAEVKVLMNSMMMIIELILTVFLERSTKKDNKNSSKPSSQTEKDETALGQSGRHGKGKPDNGQQAKNTRIKESIELSSVTFCEVCGEDLSTTECCGHERRTKIDIVFSLQLIRKISRERKNSF